MTPDTVESRSKLQDLHDTPVTHLSKLLPPFLPPVMWNPHRGVELDGKPFHFLDLLMQDGGESGAWDPFALSARQFAHLGEAVRADQG